MFSNIDFWFSKVLYFIKDRVGLYMARKPKYDGGTKEKIIEVATQMFFEKGYEGTSIRSIIKAVDCEIGLFYYYFESKDELFTQVLDIFLNTYKVESEKIVASSYDHPYQCLLRFFQYVLSCVKEFREKYADNIYKTTRWAIRDQVMTHMVPYIVEILESLVKYGAKPVMDIRPMALFLAHGVGSLLIKEDTELVSTYFEQYRTTINLLLGLDDEVSKNMLNINNIHSMGE